ncbi:hypothetical protein QIT80_gp89 (endogenous virus) [Pseudomonas phage phiAH14a]|uniref:Uncharacterized protein n=1 Tax=Pseudomonas phage phiAH14a TaxID=1805958 RepID=A0A1B0VRK6_9CAUD|nr:hypothetical protein QIT80_gp89 [Pseudomonas phage phiAH14a]AMW64549.1 hypothetical protein AH14a_p89 [Pseudomonas phage phiAH14a]
MWDGSSAVIYDSGTVPVLFTKASHSWSYQGQVIVNGTAQAYYWRNALTATLLIDEYFMINPFSRGLLQSHLNWMTSGVRFNYAQNCLQVYGISAISAWIDIGSMGAVFARLPGT